MDIFSFLKKYKISTDDKNITAWRIRDNQLQNKVKHKSGTTKWMTIKYLILPMEAEYSFKKMDGE